MSVDAVTLAHAAAAAPLAIWLYLLLARGGFWRVARALRTSGRFPLPRARAEPEGVSSRSCRRAMRREGIGKAVSSLLAQTLGGAPARDRGRRRQHATGPRKRPRRGRAACRRARAADGAARHAARTGLDGQALGHVAGRCRRGRCASPDFLLLTDADIEYVPGEVAALADKADAERLDLVSLMVRLSTATFAERCLIPAFVFFFLKLYPPAWIASPRSAVAGAAGGCMLIRSGGARARRRPRRDPRLHHR